jgi:Rieske Fe-S protein
MMTERGHVKPVSDGEVAQAGNPQSPPTTSHTALVAVATRRTVLLSVGACGAVGVAGALAGCGSGNAPAGGGSSTSGTSPSSEVMKTTDIPIGGGTVFKNANVVVTQPVAGTFKAFDATCQHLGCQVISVSDGKINCPCHGSQYNIADGSVARGPTTRGLFVKTVTITGDTITVS